MAGLEKALEGGNADVTLLFLKNYRNIEFNKDQKGILREDCSLCDEADEKARI